MSRGTNANENQDKPAFYHGRKFLSNKGNQYYEVQYQREYSNFTESSKTELDYIHKVYPAHYVERDVNIQDNIWKNVLSLQHILFNGSEQWSEYRRNKLLRDLHDLFSQTTGRCISKANLVSGILKAARGCSHQTAKDEQLCKALDSMYNSFDVNAKEQFDWRCFLFYLHFTLNPMQSAKDQLLSAFAKISHRSSCTTLQDLNLVLYPLVKADSTGNMIRMFDEAWAQVKASNQQIDDNLSSTKISMELFQQMLEFDEIDALFDQSISKWGKGRIYPVHMCRWEEEVYNETLLFLVKDSRRQETVKSKMDVGFCRTKLHVFQEWLNYARYRCSLRSILSQINHRIEMQRKLQGISAFSLSVVSQHATLLLQRVGRGFIGRNIARECWMVYTSATLIQTHSRMHLSKKRLNVLSATYSWAIVEVQRHIRGALARGLALRKLLAFIEQEHIRNVKERERLEMERGIWSLTTLQSNWRRKMAAAVADELRRKIQRELLIQRAMDTERQRFQREREIYERQLEGYYRSMKDDLENDNQIQVRVSQDQVKVRTLRRRLKNEVLKDVEPDSSEQIATEQWKKDWEAKIEAGVSDIKAHSIHCLDQPDNSVEKKTRAAIRKRIKNRVPEVLARAKERRIPMETKEAKDIARKEIIHIIGEEERALLQSEMDKALIDREQQKEDTRLQKEAYQRDAHARASVHAASLVATICRKWLARRELRRLCLEMFEKRFDEKNHTFFYRNTVTGEVSWSKPKAMGNFEVPAKDEWKILRDAHNFPYYFNPSFVEMRWTPPVTEEMCCGIVPQMWWREYPVRSGPCPNFAHRLHEDDGKRYCVDCFPE